MSIPSTDHRIYSFITLCLKEQGDVAGRMEITTKQGWGGGVEGRGVWRRSGTPSSTETYLRGRFTTQEQGPGADD